MERLGLACLHVFVDDPTAELLYYIGVCFLILPVVLARSSMGGSNKRGVAELHQVLKERELQSSLFRKKMEYLQAKDQSQSHHAHHGRTWRQMEHEQDEALLGTIPIRDQFEWVKRRRRRGAWRGGSKWRQWRRQGRETPGRGPGRRRQTGR